MIPAENRTLIFNDNVAADVTAKKLRIIHFNDVYNIEGCKPEPIGGAARFANAIEYFNKNKTSLIAFSGDAVSPSTCNLNIANFHYL